MISFKFFWLINFDKLGTTNSSYHLFYDAFSVKKNPLDTNQSLISKNKLYCICHCQNLTSRIKCPVNQMKDVNLHLFFCFLVYRRCQRSSNEQLTRQRRGKTRWQSMKVWCGSSNQVKGTTIEMFGDRILWNLWRCETTLSDDLGKIYFCFSQQLLCRSEKYRKHPLTFFQLPDMCSCRPERTAADD